MPKKIIIIGAGPIGLEAALAASQHGYDVTLFERGEVADNVKRWGHVRMFSPFAMNASQAGLALLRQQGHPLPADDACLTGTEYATAYLEPLARQLNVLTRTEVKAIARDRSGKRDKIGEPGRADTPFRLLVEHDGIERHEHADIIFDCSGTFQNPNPLGDSGIPALGETALRDLIHYGPTTTSHLAGSRVLVVGGGHSAANVIVALDQQDPATRIHWITRRDGAEPMARTADDPLPERDRICAQANEAVSSGRATWHAGTMVGSVTRDSNGFTVSFNNGTAIEVDHIIAATGFRPDWSVARELHLQTCWATEGTYPLAASLLGETGGDCLAVAAFGAALLLHPEPNFFPLGMKSYGRTPDFLIATGLQQIASLIEWLPGVS